MNLQHLCKLPHCITPGQGLAHQKEQTISSTRAQRTKILTRSSLTLHEAVVYCNKMVASVAEHTESFAQIEERSLATTERQAEARRQAILEYFRVPHTLYDGAEEWNVDHTTVWRWLTDLIEEGIIIKAPFRDGKRDKYVTDGDAGSTRKVLRIFTPNGNHPVGVWAEQQLLEVRDVGGAIAQAWRYSKYHDNPELQHLAGSITPVECKAVIRERLELVRGLVMALEQMLLLPVWETADEATADRYGVEPSREDAVVRVAVAFEQRRGQ